MDTTATTPVSIPGSKKEKSHGSDALRDWYQLDPFPGSAFLFFKKKTRKQSSGRQLSLAEHAALCSRVQRWAVELLQLETHGRDTRCWNDSDAVPTEAG